MWRKVKSILDKIRNLSIKSSSSTPTPLLRRKSSHDMSEKSSASKDAASAVPMVEVTERNDKIFMLTFATFHLSTTDYSSSLSADYVLKNQRSIQLFACLSPKGAQPDFIIKNKKEQVGLSVKKCMLGLAEAYKTAIEK